MPNQQTSAFRTFIPPHLLDHLSRSSDDRLSGIARRTIERDALQRTRRRITTVRGYTAAEPRAGADQPNRTIYDAQNQETLPGVKVRGEDDKPVQDATVNRAFSGLGATFELFQKVYGRNSIDGNGLPMDATVHYGEEYGNAFWDGERMVFGDGDGELFVDFTNAVDVIGHELAHGVTQYTANLEYFAQSGALNESLSDVFGILIKQYADQQRAEDSDWLIGAGILGPAVEGTALRSMKAPGTAYDDDVLGKDPQPATMADYVQTSQDNGGVHINSGIPNHAFYLAAVSLGGYAWERAGKIWYDVLTGGQLKKDAQFADFAQLTIDAAKARYGDTGAEAEAVTKAWSQVGVLGSEAR